MGAYPESPSRSPRRVRHISLRLHPLYPPGHAPKRGSRPRTNVCGGSLRAGTRGLAISDDHGALSVEVACDAGDRDGLSEGELHPNAAICASCAQDHITFVDPERATSGTDGVEQDFLYRYALVRNCLGEAVGGSQTRDSAGDAAGSRIGIGPLEAQHVCLASRRGKGAQCAGSAKGERRLHLILTLTVRLRRAAPLELVRERTVRGIGAVSG